jgi:hypothetical protein
MCAILYFSTGIILAAFSARKIAHQSMLDFTVKIYDEFVDS